MRVRFYERTVDGKVVDYFRFEFDGGLTVVDKPAEEHERRAYYRQWNAHVARKQKNAEARAAMQSTAEAAHTHTITASEMPGHHHDTSGSNEPPAGTPLAAPTVAVDHSAEEAAGEAVLKAREQQAANAQQAKLKS